MRHAFYRYNANANGLFNNIYMKSNRLKLYLEFYPETKGGRLEVRFSVLSRIIPL